MKERTVGSGGAQSDDFDLDSFLRENSFLYDDDTIEEPESKPSKWASLGSKGTQASSAGQEAVIDDLNATMSYEALGEDYPEIPLVSDNEQDADENTSVEATGAVSETLILSPIVLESIEDPEAGTPDVLDQQAASPVIKARPGRSSSKASKQRKTAASSDAVPLDAALSDEASLGALLPTIDPSVSSITKKTRMASPKVKQASQQKANSKSRVEAPAKQRQRLTTLADPGDFHAAKLDDSSYRIRGGGKRHNKRTPVMVILIAVVIIAGVGLTAYFFKDVYVSFTTERAADKVVKLSSNETRRAIDEEMPVILDYLSWNAGDIHGSFVENGWNVVVNERATSDNPDRSASGSEIIRLPHQVSADVLQGYYESEFNVYNFDELQDYFNGAWMLDVSHGNQGSYARLKYVNFASESLVGELEHLRFVQQLTNDNSVVDARGEDEFGNNYIQGYTVIGEKTYFWKVIGIEFSDYYRGQDRRKLPNTAVFVKCTIASFDFFGVNTSLTDDTGTQDTGSGETTGDEDKKKTD